MNDNYIVVHWIGLPREKFLVDESFSINSKFFKTIRFQSNEIVQFYFREDVEVSTFYKAKYLQECKSILLRFYITISANSSKSKKSYIYIDEKERCFFVNGKKEVSLDEQVLIRDAVTIERKDNNGNLISEQAFMESQRDFFHEAYQKMFNEMPVIPEEKQSVLYGMLTIQNCVLRYAMLYSYLYELCKGNSSRGSQNETSSFIKSTVVFKTLYDYIPKEKRRIHTDYKKAFNEDIFTYYRNVIGHSLEDVLNFSEKEAIAHISVLTPKLLEIVVLKIKEIADGENEV